MSPLPPTEITAFVPARDSALSKRFYSEFGFTPVACLPDATS
ncbi:hypothetical protein J2W49_005145 [Hydrogenophaga palleronii]|uniref:Glyoxalase n=1 Tax=Hydrogenophaga palleronii TaxID=65655 RepID=A0ABU1WV16_9BURK|nr:hypothetical protein [Hydrogenophaga palleronii]